MNKLEMAHEFGKAVLSNPTVKLNAETLKQIVSNSWNYADAMQAEADKREKQKAIDDSESSRVFFEKLTDIPNQYSSPEWQPDWSQAPDDCHFFCVASNGGYGFFTNLEPELMGDYFYVGCGGLMIENHGYTGDWRDSVRKRP